MVRNINDNSIFQKLNTSNQKAIFVLMDEGIEYYVYMSQYHVNRYV